MYLKSLEIQGFKSFPDKISLQFGDDITAIVGPNGSGKSNISDAIRWVMGEQSTKALRGGKMEDVIFGGTLKRPQMGFAEASLIFDNTDRYFPIEADEVMVTRRYYRSGENEFYINRQSVRLKDVNELFMDTGLGREGYSNISQGRIDEILAVKSTDRREIFEEAAGISKYRHRKEETERRLVHTEDNLLRIQDKISELELQVEPLREQSEKAKQYLTLRDELKGLEVAVWLQSLTKLAASAKKAEEDYASAQFILNAEHENIEQLYKKTEALSDQLRRQDLSLEEKRGEIEAAGAVRQELVSKQAAAEAEHRNILDNLQRLDRELAEHDQRSGGVQNQIADRHRRIQEIAAESEAAADQIKALETRLKELTESSEGISRSFLELRNLHGACMAELAGRQADLSALQTAIQQNTAHRDELRSDRDSASARSADTEASLNACREALKKAREAVQSAQNTISGYQLRQKTRAEKVAALQNDLQQITVQSETVGSKLKLLREMERDYEGYSKAVKFVMQQAGSGALRNIHGPISQLIHTDDAYAVAMETALGSAMQNIVVRSEEDAKQAIRLLKNRDIGRATFLPISAMTGKTLQERGLNQCAGFVGIASELVTCDGQYRAIVEYLLGRTVIAEDLDDAIAISRTYQNRFRIVTLDGQVMNAGGSMTGGSVNRNSGILSRANEIKRLSAELASMQAKRDAAAAQLTEAKRQLDLVVYELETAREQLRTHEDQILRLEGEEKQYAVLFDAIRQASEGNRRELDTLEYRLKTDSRRSAAVTEEIAGLTRRQQELQDKIDTLSADQSTQNAEADALSDELTKARMKLAGLSAERQTAEESLRQLEALSGDLEGARSQKEDAITELNRVRDQKNAELQEISQQILQQTAAVEALQAELRQLLDERAGVEAQRTGTDRTLQQKNKDIIDMEREAARLETKKNAAQMEEKQILDKLWDSYELTPSTAQAAAAEIESAAAANRRISELRRKIHSLGTPNLGAIEEYERVSERYEYLSGQRDDVLRSKKELEGIIREITRHMTDIFTEEFARINHYFGETFVEMFHGGKASLELEDPAEPLSCGIEIKVQPPGKQLKTITLLSGGEKAFVAIALYFSILKVRPTPFCMLDEIDAALDDRNVERFAEYLRLLCKKTQFIVITHRRGTMEEADALFGVTMQEQGVSKLLQLDLDRMEKELGIVN
ncbi:MAG: chromosome segregation protein SMC [Oscillospiraceae bacterium]|nr:chromosome segregation protein SMC [Oscillospiraceae bacterium]